MNPAEALALLRAESPPGEVWPLHCRQVARVAVTQRRGPAEMTAPVLYPTAFVVDDLREPLYGLRPDADPA